VIRRRDYGFGPAGQAWIVGSRSHAGGYLNAAFGVDAWISRISAPTSTP